MIRLLAATVLVLLPSAALAQRVDTRRSEVTKSADGTMCRFNGVSGLQLSEPLGAAPGAVWELNAIEAGANRRVNLLFLFLQGGNGAFGVAAKPLGIDLGDPALTARVASATLSLDDNPQSFAFVRKAEAEGPDLLFTGDPDRFVEILAETQTARLELALEPGASPVTFHWNVRKFRDIPELLDLVHWSCTSPDRG
ncbi:hypothetical protein [Sphingomonas sp.]|uniref:hypothetical protein n=1 Tax=Sphingomonas sp. TaxID=28214 RepID=UPI001B26AD8D|nr:hypothetical protein [Sphingomonas sp.]MBO9713743.1 hypothetical protein [Sphingomonas sp.]